VLALVRGLHCFRALLLAFVAVASLSCMYTVGLNAGLKAADTTSAVVVSRVMPDETEGIQNAGTTPPVVRRTAISNSTRGDDSSYNGKAVNPLMKCQQAPGSKDAKLVFVHVFKAAGSTMRSFFRDYSKVCKRGFTLVTGCSMVSVTTAVFVCTAPI
jgi:hypothetical protein